MPDNPTAELEKRLKAARTPDDYHSALKEAMSALSGLSEGVCHHYSITLACKAGCFLCCYFRVMATPPEIFAIADHIQRRFAAIDQQRVRQRLALHLKTIQPLTPNEHLKKNIECPLLHEGKCSVYPVRPFGCRYHHSKDFQACQFSYDHPEDVDYFGARHPTLMEHMGKARASLEDVYVRMGLDMMPYELGSALNEALESSTPWKRWRSHKRTFLNAHG